MRFFIKIIWNKKKTSIKEVSIVNVHKPCSVPLTGVTIYLYVIIACISFENTHAPTKIWVASLWGLPRFILLFLKDSFLWHVT